MIKALRYPAINSSPEVILDKKTNEFIFTGKSFPEDAKLLYRPIITWIEKYVDDPNDNTIIEFNMEYFNSASAKIILDILEIFATVEEKGKSVIIHWHYADVDEDMKYAGELYSEESNIPIKLISY